ncbi:unnamed protein product [Camellia sinensis]
MCMYRLPFNPRRETITTTTLLHLHPHRRRQFNSSAQMGKQRRSQTQIQTQPHPDATTTAATTTTTDLAIAPSQPPSPTTTKTKIPIRRRKKRKLSAAAKSHQENPKSSSPKNKLYPLQPKPIQRIVSRSLSCDGEIEIALRHLRNSDPQLAPLIEIYPPPTFDSFQPPFHALAKSILYQQLACKAGTTIYTRFVALCGGESSVLPNTVLALNPQQLRHIGVSGRKASYLHDLSRKYQNGILSDSSIVEMDDKSLFTMLTMVNGIGSWSVHMFMIFSLHRPDVLPVNDLGIRKGVQLHFGLEDLPRPSQMEQLCDKWRPYRSVASWYMWRFAEAKGAPSSSGALAAPATSLQLQQQEQQQQQLQQHEHQQQQHQQFLDPINGILNLGACAWGQ